MDNPEKNRKQIIAMAGLPGTGKTTIASELAKRLGGMVLNKDKIRGDLFPDAVDFSREQDDLCMEVIFLIAGYLLKANPEQTLIIDGRTFSRSEQVEQLLWRAQLLKVKPVIIRCVCEDAIAKQRLDDDQRRGAHPAANRSFRLYRELKEKAEPLRAGHLIIDTGKESLERSVERCLAYLKNN